MEAAQRDQNRAEICQSLAVEGAFPGRSGGGCEDRIVVCEKLLVQSMPKQRLRTSLTFFCVIALAVLFADQGGPKLRTIHLPLPPGCCAGIKGVHQHTLFFFFFFFKAGSLAQANLKLST